MSDDLLRELGAELPWDKPDANRSEAVRAAMLAAATSAKVSPRAPSTRRGPLAVAAFALGALATFAVTIVIVRTNSPTSPGAAVSLAKATLTTSVAAQVERTITANGTGTDETVRVREGTVRVAVGEPRRGDHVRLRTADATVEGAGDYEVVVIGDALTTVAIHAGSATIRVAGHAQPVFLASGETWHAAVTTTAMSRPDDRVASTAVPAVIAPERRATPAAPPQELTKPARRGGSTALPPSHDRVRTTSAGASPATNDDSHAAADLAERTPIAVAPRVANERLERRFKEGWALLRAGKAREAASELELAADAGGDAPLASDARYFQAVALTRAGDGPGAERALVAFMDHAPTSLRRGRAAVMLGRLIAARGDRLAARSWFTTAVDDPDPEVATAARAGLAALGE